MTTTFSRPVLWVTSCPTCGCTGLDITRVVDCGHCGSRHDVVAPFIGNVGDDLL